MHAERRQKHLVNSSQRMCCIINSEIYSSVCGYNNSKLIKQCEIFQQKNLLKNVSHLCSWRCVCCAAEDGKIRCFLNFYDKCSAFCDLFCFTDRYRRSGNNRKNTCKKNRSSTSQNDIFLLPLSPFTSILCFTKFLSQFSLFYRLLTINCLCCCFFLSPSFFLLVYLFPKKSIIYIWF